MLWALASSCRLRLLRPASLRPPAAGPSSVHAGRLRPVTPCLPCTPTQQGVPYSVRSRPAPHHLYSKRHLRRLQQQEPGRVLAGAVRDERGGARLHLRWPARPLPATPPLLHPPSCAAPPHTHAPFLWAAGLSSQGRALAAQLAHAGGAGAVPQPAAPAGARHGADHPHRRRPRLLRGPRAPGGLRRVAQGPPAT